MYMLDLKSGLSTTFLRVPPCFSGHNMSFGSYLLWHLTGKAVKRGLLYRTINGLYCDTYALFKKFITTVTVPGNKLPSME